MTKTYQPRNIRVFAVSNGNQNGFNIVLDFSGQKEFLVHHRHNGLLYRLLSRGMHLDDLRRWKPNRLGQAQGMKMERTVNFLLKQIDFYLDEKYYDDIA